VTDLVRGERGRLESHCRSAFVCDTRGAVRSGWFLPLVLLAGCGGSKPAKPQTVFDPSAAAETDSADPNAVERLYKPFDLPYREGHERWIGVTVLRGGVRFSRPVHWSIREAGDDTGRPFIRYVSPRAYSFALYERDDGPGAPWDSIQDHYETDVTAVGAKFLGQRVPTATAVNQGRAYTIERKAEGKKPAVSRSREILLRGVHHIVLLQVVAEGDGLTAINGELLEILQHLEVL